MPKAPVPTDWIPSTEAATRLGVTKRRVNMMAQRGEIRAERFGNVWRIDAASLESPEVKNRRPGPRTDTPPAKATRTKKKV